MNLNELISAVLSAPKGIDRKIVQERPAKVKKAFLGLDLVKRSTFYGRFVNYGNQKTVIEAKKNGQTDCPNNWQSLSKDCDGLFLDNKDQYKICVGHPAFQHEHKSEYFLDGHLVELDDIKDMLLSSEYNKKPTPDWYTLNVENIISIDNFTFDKKTSKALPFLERAKTNLLPSPKKTINH